MRTIKSETSGKSVKGGKRKTQNQESDGALDRDGTDEG